MHTNHIENIHIDYDELISDIAKENEAIVSRDDPIFISVHLNKILIEKYLDAVNNNITIFQKSIESELSSFGEKNDEMLKKVINQYSPVLEKELRLVAEQSAENLGALMKEQIGHVEATLNNTVRTQKRLAVVAIISSLACVTVLGWVFLLIGD